MFFLAQGGSDRIGKRADGIVEDEQVALLVFVECRYQTLQDGLHVRLQSGTRLLFERGKGAAPGFLDSLVGVEDHAQKL